MMNVLVSGCILGIGCRYDCKIKEKENVISFLKENNITPIPVCPEQLGGRPTPRIATEVKNGRVIERNGTDHTQEFEKGAAEALKIAKLCGCKYAILKSKSPSCAFGKIYDGTFSKTLTDGNGIAADLLHKNGIIIKNEENFAEILEKNE